MSEVNSPLKPVHTERIFVTSEMARKWLRLNMPGNRPISEPRVKQYARDMKNGKWQENGDTIKFSDTGELIDGQKRLTACVECGIGFWSLIAYGVKREAFITIDRNQTRSTGQLLHLTAGISDYNNVSSALRWLTGFRDGIVLNHARPTSGEIADMLAAHPGVVESVAQAARVIRRFRAGPTGLVAFCHYLFTRQDATLAELFFDSLATGAGLRESDPVHRLRERIIASSASASKRIEAYELIALFFKAWLAEREQRTVHSTLRWQTGESFPNIGPITTNAKLRLEAVAPPVKPKRQPVIPVPPKKRSVSKLDDLLSRAMSLDKR